MRSVGNKLGAILFFAGVLTLSAAAWSATPKGKVSLSERTEQLADLVNSAVPENGRRTVTGLNEDGTVRVRQVDEGYVRNLASPGRTYFPVRGAAQNAEAVARGFLAAQQDLLLNRTERVQFITRSVKPRGAYSFVRLDQRYQGVPVWGAEMVVQVFGTRGVSYVSSDLMRDTAVLDSGALSTQPTLSAAQAIERALAACPEYKPETLQAETPQLVIYEPSVLGLKGETRLVWKMDVVSLEEGLFRQCVLVDAHTGDIALKFNQIRNYLRRDIYDAVNQRIDLEVFYGNPARFEGDVATGIADVDAVYDYLGDAYNFYGSHYGRDSINDVGMTLSATARYREQNAYWDGRRIVIGTGWATDDLTVHEYTHGVTQYESNLIYLKESGAINEAFSDIWGEWVDLTNDSGKDSSAYRWEIGEDMATGAIRSMKDPTKYSSLPYPQTYPDIGVPLPMPDRYNSPYWYFGEYDNYGVHHNMGVGDKLAYLLTDGETFNGYEVKGLGIDTAADLFWIVQSSLLTEASDYLDLYPALLQAGRYLGLDLQNITRACMAVEIVPSDYMTPFKITYSGCDLKVVDGVSLLVENCTAKASVNIQKISRFPSNVQLTNNYDAIKPGLVYMASETMPLVKVTGNLRRFQTQARIFSLEVSGTLDTVVASETNIGSISAAGIRRLSISDQLPGPRTVTSIVANGNPIPDTFKTINVNLKGVTLKKLDMPNQSAVIKASTRKVQEQGVIVYIARADLGGVSVGDSLTATATGANVVGDMVARGVVKKVVATPITYTREGVSRTYGGFIGDPDGDLLYTNEERIRMSVWDHQVWIAGGEKGWPGQSSALVGTVSAPLGILAYVVAGYDQYPEFPTVSGKVSVLSTKKSAAGSQGLWGIMAKNAATTAKLVGDPTAFVSQRIRLFETLQKLPPDNDNVAGARALGAEEGLAYGTNVWATAEVGEPDHAGLSASHSVWWRWTAPKDMRVTFTTQGSRFHSVLSVYTGSAPSNLVAVSHLDTSSDEYSAIHFAAEAGKSYLICVDGNPSLSDAEAGSRNTRGAGQGMIQLQWKAATAPDNDDFANAADLGASAGTLTATNYLSTRETGEPDHAGVHGSASVWYSITLDTDSRLVIYTAGSTFDTLLAAYSGDSFGDLTLMGENDNTDANVLTSEIAFDAQAGVTYYIAVDGKPGDDMGTIQLTWSARPVNDDFADALPISGTQGFTMGSNVNATFEDGEYNASLGEISASVWWRFTAPATSTTVPMVFDTLGSSFDTVLLVYTGPRVDRLTLVDYNDDATTMSLSSGWSQLQVPMTGGQTYMICVCGLNETEAGSIVLSWQQGEVAGLRPVSGAAPSGRGDLPVYQPEGSRGAVADLRAQYAKLRAWYRIQSVLLSRKGGDGGAQVQ